MPNATKPARKPSTKFEVVLYRIDGAKRVKVERVDVCLGSDDDCPVGPDHEYEYEHPNFDGGDNLLDTFKGWLRDHLGQ